MAYEDVYNLGTDPRFRNRLVATLTTESAVKTNDTLADQVLRNPDGTSLWFMPFISSPPDSAISTRRAGRRPSRTPNSCRRLRRHGRRWRTCIRTF